MRSRLLSALEALAGLSELEKINAAAATVRASRMYPAAMRFLPFMLCRLLPLCDTGMSK